MKVAMAQKRAQKAGVKDQIMADWKAERITSDEAQDRLKQAGV